MLTQRVREALTGYVLVAPSILLFAVFFLYPLFDAFQLSFFEWDLIGEPEWVGTTHYESLATDERFHATLSNTAIYSCATVLLTMVGGLALALLLNRQGVLWTWIRSSIFTSYIVSWVGVSLLWLWILDTDYGAFNSALALIGIEPVGWLTDPDVALWSLVVVSVWKLIGYDMIIYMAGLQAIPQDLYEAAAMDGAGRWARLRYITLPQLGPTTLFLTITSFVMTFQAFDVVRVMTQGGPVHATNVYVYFIYEQAFQYFHVGYASAAVVVFFAAIMTLTVVQFKLFSKKETS